MKTLLLVRHAKSSWENFSVTDEERPLNDRGKKNAPEMAARLLARKVSIDAFVSSPARRALSTAVFFANAYQQAESSIVLVPALYHANPGAFLTAVQGLSDAASDVAIFSHNNGITEFANSLSEARIDHMPTCAVFAVRCPVETWSDFAQGGNEFYFFDYPRNSLQ